ncbi:sensor histidine kinase [Lacrimispora saccharolytica]|uniref:sensor histidine kinase n=1 Tax=Lacrimispora saccharolytica TaxID=84030 RepID=UPI00265D1AA7|nr:sensor histidine kinase [Lacrimispora saccharolytica]MBS7329886.1 sensor histidine kinase [Lachnospiraceae bacterium]MCF2657436.1 sensor histidine kinase [Lacrimispora saccharolytica]MCI7557044.1 sensor histidine kinase [Lachnospiraceae bacterium]MDD7548496.1 sensor histidine kinase [Lachnospiraceae bacterium]MDY4127057.1 sensor histidine kinase [Lachnospiraceae bacterium]
MKSKFSRFFHRIEKIYKTRSIQFIVSMAFTMVALVSMGFMELATYSSYMKSSREAAIDSNMQIVDHISMQLNSYIRNMMSISDSMYYNVIKDKDLTKDNLDKEMSLLYEANKDNLISIACISQDGALITASPVATRKASVDFKTQDWFLSAEDKVENMHFSTPHVQNMFESSNYRYYWVVSLSRSVELTYLGIIRRGILLVDMNFSSIEQMFDKLNENGSGYIYLIDSDGEIIYHPNQKAIYSGLATENNVVAAGYDDGDYTETFMGSKRSVIVKTVGYTGWKIVSVIPNENLYVNYEELSYITVIIFTITILLILLGNIIISGIVTDPIRRLDDSLKYLEGGSMDEEAIYFGGSHEIRHLSTTIKSMVVKMRKLMDDWLKEQEEKTKSELDALQSQINPHFLYNTLDSVVWMIESERYKEAIAMITSLASLFRISLSKGNTIITIKDELTHAANYLSIQKVRFKNKFDARFEIDPAIEDCMTIKLIIQPLIENAIYYGVNPMDEDGLITIRGYEKDEDIFIEVIDNGMGMPAPVVEKLLTHKKTTNSKGSGIGLWNVNQRIRLYFKGDYGLSIASEPDEGTKVTIHLPKITQKEYKENQHEQE